MYRAAVAFVLLFSAVLHADSVADLKSPDAAVRAKAAAALATMKNQDGLTPLCRAIAVEKDETTRVAMLEALEKLSPLLYQHITTILVDRNKVRGIEGIRKLKSKPGAAFLALYAQSFVPDKDRPNLMNEETWLVKSMEVIEDVDQTTDGHADLLLKICEATDKGIFIGHVATRPFVGMALLARNKPQETQRMVKELTKFLDSKNPDFVSSAAAALGLVGPAAKDAAPKLKTLKLSPNALIRSAATEAVKKIDQ